tara:strand:- start:604 stop:2256 length:1653 start_codon:yes stop_codon:yes gene_type:complete
MKMKTRVIIILLIFNHFYLFSQDTKINLQKVNVVDNYTPKISISRKISDTPTINDTTKNIKKINYSFIEKNFNIFKKIDTISFAKIKKEPITKLYSKYLKIGLGNTSLPLIEGIYSSTRNKNWVYSARYAFQNSKSKTKDYDASFRNNIFHVDAKRIFSFGYIKGNISRESNVFSSHGSNSNLSESQRRQYWAYSNLNLTFENFDKKNIDYISSFKFSDLNENKENQFIFNTVFKKKFSLYNYSFLVEADINKHKINNSTLINDQNIFKLKPLMSGYFYGLKCDFGIKQYSIIKQNSDSKFNVFPYFKIKQILIPETFNVQFVIDGDINKNTYSSLSRINPFIVNTHSYDGVNLNLQNTITKYRLNFFLETKLLSDLSLIFTSNFSNKLNNPFFVLDKTTSYQNKFSILYDDINQFTFKTQLEWSPSDYSGLELTSIYHHYTSSYLSNVYDLPSFEFLIDGYYNLGNKFIGRINLFAEFHRIGIQKNSENNLLEEVILDNIIDFNLNFEYKYNSVLSAYLEGKRLIGGYEYWLNYPVVSPEIFLGISYKF